jgi:hypothetical protein
MLFQNSDLQGQAKMEEIYDRCKLATLHVVVGNYPVTTGGNPDFSEAVSNLGECIQYIKTVSAVFILFSCTLSSML